MDDILPNKAAAIRRCLARIHDAIVLNLQRACEAAIDWAMHEISLRKLGVPQASKDAFTLLEKARLIPSAVSKNMKSMGDFRNIAAHDDQAIQEEILKAILTRHLGYFDSFPATLGL